MNQKIALSALALALVLGGASGAIAGGKKHNEARGAYAASATQVSDPRQNKGSNHEGWCDIDPKCNGWAEWAKDVSEGKLQDK